MNDIFKNFSTRSRAHKNREPLVSNQDCQVGSLLVSKDGEIGKIDLEFRLIAYYYLYPVVIITWS